jgi:hypothetical protein
MGKPGRGGRGRWVAPALACALLLAYGASLRHGFLNFDDNIFIFENQHVREGLTTAEIR